MAAHPIAIVHDGIVDIPEEAKSDPRFQNGAKLELVPVATPEAEQKSDWSDWRRLEGFFADYPGDPNAALDEERKRELEQEARW